MPHEIKAGKRWIAKAMVSLNSLFLEATAKAKKVTNDKDLYHFDHFFYYSTIYLTKNVRKN